MFTLSLSAYQTLTILQPHIAFSSLKMVSANAPKELPNVLPKCNPFLHHIVYDGYGIVGLRRCEASCGCLNRFAPRTNMPAKSDFCSKRCSSKTLVRCCKTNRLLAILAAAVPFAKIAKNQCALAPFFTQTETQVSVSVGKSANFAIQLATSDLTAAIAAAVFLHHRRRKPQLRIELETNN
jgi:hypothetical protein